MGAAAPCEDRTHLDTTLIGGRSGTDRGDWEPSNAVRDGVCVRPFRARKGIGKPAMVHSEIPSLTRTV